MAVAAPLLRGGNLLLLDFVYGPKIAPGYRATEGLQGPTNAAPLETLAWLIRFAGPFAAFLLILVVLFGVGYAFSRATRAVAADASFAGRVVGGVLYTINPFTYSRLVHGHIGLLAGMALLPLVVVALVRLREKPTWPNAALLGLAVAGVGFASIHMLGITLVVFPLLLLIAGWPGVRPLLVAAGTTLLASSWWLVQVPTNGLPPFGVADLSAFTAVPTGVTSAGHVAALYGFWRVGEFALPRDGVWAWQLTFAPIALAALAGAAIWWKRNRRAAIGLLLGVVVSVLLASGISFPPTAGAFRWLYETVPGFRLFREPQKFVAVTVFAYALLAASAVDRLVRRAAGASRGTGRRRVEALAVTLACLGVVLFYGRTMILNFEAMRPVEFPRDWHTANDIMRAEPGRAVVLPWHLYMTFPFTGNRIANPAGTFFDADVIAGDAIEIGSIRTQSTNPESRVVERVVFGDHARLGEAMNELCARWIVLYKTADWESYAWLDSASGIRQAFDGPSIRLYRAATLRCAP